MLLCMDMSEEVWLDFNDNQNYINGSTQNKPSLQWDPCVYVCCVWLCSEAQTDRLLLSTSPEKKRCMARHTPTGEPPTLKLHPAVLLASH